MYTYNTLLDDINYLSHFGVETGSIGASECGRLIPYIFAGKRNTQNNIIITGAIHAREHISALLVMRQAFYFFNNYNTFKNLDGGIYFIPMLNPDGCLLCAEGLCAAPRSKHTFLCGLNNNSDDFSLWKANINGVDLNTNFGARFGTGAKNVFNPSAENYVGACAFSECETKAIRDFTLKIMPKATLSYHAKGEELYWEFYQEQTMRERDEKFADYLNGYLGYKKLDGAQNSAGGYKDWCISALKIPAVTIELIPDIYSHPLTNDALLSEDYEKNKDLPVKALEYIINHGL